MADGDYLLLRLTLESLDETHADYIGPNGASASIDRAAFVGQHMPRQVFVLVTEDFPAAMRQVAAQEGEVEPKPDPCDTFSESGTTGLCGWCSRLEIEHPKVQSGGSGT